MEFSRQEYWSGLLLPSPGDLHDPGIEPVSPALAGRFFTVCATRGIYLCEGGSIVIPILQMQQLKLRDLTHLAQGKESKPRLSTSSASGLGVPDRLKQANQKRKLRKAEKNKPKISLGWSHALATMFQEGLVQQVPQCTLQPVSEDALSPTPSESVLRSEHLNPVQKLAAAH